MYYYYLKQIEKYYGELFRKSRDLSLFLVLLLQAWKPFRSVLFLYFCVRIITLGHYAVY